MFTLSTIILLVSLHFVSDFILQSDWMAQNKSSSNKALGIHVIVYSIPFLIIGPLYALVNGILHFFTDYVSSRVSKKLWEKKEVHWFFAVIGLDQLIHYICLFTTYSLIFGEL